MALERPRRTPNWADHERKANAAAQQFRFDIINAIMRSLGLAVAVGVEIMASLVEEWKVSKNSHDKQNRVATASLSWPGHPMFWRN